VNRLPSIEEEPLALRRLGRPGDLLATFGRDFFIIGGS